MYLCNIQDKQNEKIEKRTRSPTTVAHFVIDPVPKKKSRLYTGAAGFVDGYISPPSEAAASPKKATATQRSVQPRPRQRRQRRSVQQRPRQRRQTKAKREKEEEKERKRTTKRVGAKAKVRIL